MKIWPARKTTTLNCASVMRLLSAFVDCQLSLEKQAAVQHHVNTCRECREELGSLEATVAVLQQLPEVAPLRPIASPDFQPSRVPRAVPALGMVTAMVGLLLVFTFTADLTNLFQATPGNSDNLYSENDDTIGRSQTLDLNGSSMTEEPDQDSMATLPTENAWLRPLEYGLAGTVVILGGATFVLWRKSGRPRPADNRN